jgi:hypothetical protein
MGTITGENNGIARLASCKGKIRGIIATFSVLLSTRLQIMTDRGE